MKTKELNERNIPIELAHMIFQGLIDQKTEKVTINKTINGLHIKAIHFIDIEIFGLGGQAGICVGHAYINDCRFEFRMRHDTGLGTQLELFQLDLDWKEEIKKEVDCGCDGYTLWHHGHKCGRK